MNIPDPKALPEDRVRVLNHRMKPSAWESAEVSSLHYTPTHLRSTIQGGTYEVEGGWTYRVWISRPRIEDRYGRSKGGGYAIEVGDDAISVSALDRDRLRKESGK